MFTDKWNRRFMELAKHISTWSKDPSTQVGAVIADELNRIVSVGYNGFARSVDDTMERLDNRSLKYEMVVHAEPNAILFAKQSLSGCSIYVYPLPPCSRCAALIIQSGLKKVFFPKQEIHETWKNSWELSKQMFDEAGVEYIELKR